MAGQGRAPGRGVVLHGALHAVLLEQLLVDELVVLGGQEELSAGAGDALCPARAAGPAGNALPSLQPGHERLSRVSREQGQLLGLPLLPAHSLRWELLPSHLRGLDFCLF